MAERSRKARPKKQEKPGEKASEATPEEPEELGGKVSRPRPEKQARMAAGRPGEKCSGPENLSNAGEHLKRLIIRVGISSRRSWMSTGEWQHGQADQSF